MIMAINYRTVMRTTYIRTVLLTALFAVVLSACDDLAEPLVEELNFNRALSPLALEATVRDKITIELNWNVRADVDHYVVEFSADSLLFSDIARTVIVTPEEVPIQEAFFGDTRYSARVKAIGVEDVTESKWSTITVKTDPENIFTLPLQDGDVEGTSATLKWTAGSEVTHFRITPENIERAITSEEKAAGEATITDLVGYTNHTVSLYAGNSKRGTVDFRTLADPDGPNTISVQPTDDLNAVIAAANVGATLVLEPGDYLVYTGTVVVGKSLNIRGHYPYDMPKIHVEFSLTDGVESVEVSDVEMVGDGTLLNAFVYATSSATYGSLNVVDSYIHDYTRALFGGTGVTSTIQSISLSNSRVYNVVSTGGDFIDFRVGYLANLTLLNSTFMNCAPARDFIRLDNSSATFPGLVSNVLIDHCTLYGVSNGNNRRYLYVRFTDNVLTVKNTIIAGTAGLYTNQPLSSQPTCANNNYFNAPGFYTPDYVTNVKVDVSGNYTTLDPGFADPIVGDFTVSNQTLIDGKVGDPRWRP
jgi:hypothetical protein